MLKACLQYNNSDDFNRIINDNDIDFKTKVLLREKLLNKYILQLVNGNTKLIKNIFIIKD